MSWMIEVDTPDSLAQVNLGCIEQITRRLSQAKTGGELVHCATLFMASGRMIDTFTDYDTLCRLYATTTGQGVWTDRMLEQLAAQEHEQWSTWTRHVLDRLAPLIRLQRQVATDDQRRALDDIARWRKQIVIDYADLTEAEKESDRDWAFRALFAIGMKRPK